MTFGLDSLPYMNCIPCISNTYLVRFQTSPGVQNYLREQNVNSLGQLHQSLNNGGRIAWEIYRQRMLLYPQGTQLLGALFQYEQETRGPEAVRVSYTY